MRRYPHPVDESTVRELYTETLPLIDTDPALLQQAARERNADRFVINADQARQAACFLYALETPRAEVLAAAQQSVQHWQWALAAGAVLHPSRFSEALSLALLCGNQQAAQMLAALPREQYTSPGVRAPELSYQLAGLLATAVLRSPAAAGHFQAVQQLWQERQNKLVPAVPDLVAPLALAALRGDPAALQQASQEHAPQYARIYRKSSLRETADALLDVWSLGFLALAAARGVALPPGNPYLGVALLQG